MSRKLIVGLGNPGRKYKSTRHNIGYLVVEKLARKFAGSFSKKTSRVELAELGRDKQEIIVAKPTTFMNESGRAVKEVVELYDVSCTNDLLVILDDVELEFGKLRLREKGRSGGHRGLQSLIDELGTSAFQRLRIGVGKPREENPPLEEYVLERFSKGEEKKLPGVLKRALEASLLWLESGPQTVMNQYNK